MLHNHLKTILILISLSTVVKSQDITPGTNDDGTLYFNVANTYFEVDPSFGARISAFKCDGENIMFGNKQSNGYLWGGTLWQSPQSEWSWPPSVALDQEPYTGGITGNTIDLLSNEDENYNTHLTFRKVFTGSSSDSSINITYTMINNGSTAHSYSAWELARVPAGGLAFFPYGSGSITGNFASYVDKIDDIAWYKYGANDPEQRKYFSDGAEGWDAWLSASGILFVRKFEDAPANKHAPGETEIELWFNGHGSYFELELQSAYTKIPANSSFTWHVKWYLRKIPENISREPGSKALVEYARAIVNRSSGVISQQTREPDFLVYPNPSEGTIHFQSKTAFQFPVHIEIYNTQGSQIYKGDANQNTTSIELQHIPAGIYQYIIKSNLNTLQIGKFMVVNS